MALLRNKGFLLLAGGQFLSTFADWTLRVLLLIWIYQLTKSGFAVSLVGLAEAFPLLLLSPIAGVFIDRWSRSKTMTSAILVRALLLLPLLIIQSGSGIVGIFVVSLLANSASQFSDPAASAALPMIVDKQHIGQANSLLSFVNSIIYIVGPAAASLLFIAVGPHTTIVWVCLVLCIAALLLFFVPASHATREESETLTMFSEIVTGLQYIKSSSILLILISVVFIAILGTGALTVLNVVFVNRALHLPPATVAVLLSSSGIGSLVGGGLLYLANKWITGRYHLVLGGTLLASGIVFLIYSFTSSLSIVIILVFFVGLLAPGVNVSFFTLVQLVTRDAVMGRVISFLGMAMAVARILSQASGGILADFFGVRQVIGGAAILMIAASLLSLSKIRSVSVINDNSEKVEENVSLVQK